MGRSKIEWCDNTWNPVTGCMHDDQCIYCPGRSKIIGFSGDIRRNLALTDYYTKVSDVYILDNPIKKEEGGQIQYPFGYKPTVHKYKLDKLPFLSACKVYIGSVGELFGPWISDEWIQRVFLTCVNNPQHIYMFLTSYPERYEELSKKRLLPVGTNMWYGIYDHGNSLYVPKLSGTKNIFVKTDLYTASCQMPNNVQWVIAESLKKNGGRNKSKVEDLNIIVECSKKGIPVFASAPDILSELEKYKCWPETMDRYMAKFMYTKNQREKLCCLCNVCKNEFPKKAMYPIESRVIGKKRSTFRTIGYVCSSCMNTLQAMYGFDFDKLREDTDEKT